MQLVYLVLDWLRRGLWLLVFFGLGCLVGGAAAVVVGVLWMEIEMMEVEVERVLELHPFRRLTSVYTASSKLRYVKIAAVLNILPLQVAISLLYSVDHSPLAVGPAVVWSCSQR